MLKNIYLEVLDLSDTEITDEAGQILAATFQSNSSMSKLFLTNNKMGILTAMTFVSVMKENVRIRLLDLSGNQMKLSVID